MGVRDGDRGVPWERPSTFSVLPVCAWEGITVGEVAYGSLASVYEWLVPDAKASPAGSAQAFEVVTAGARPGAQILDCACGIGLLAVGLAQAGFRVTACDASPAMAGRTRALARAHRVGVPARVCRWDQLPGQSWQDRFGAVLCVGNSLAHAVGRSGRARRDRRHGIRAGDGWGAGADLPQLGADPLGRQPGWTSGTGSWSAPPARQWWCTPGRCRLHGRPNTACRSPWQHSTTVTGCR